MSIRTAPASVPAMTWTAPPGSPGRSAGWPARRIPPGRPVRAGFMPATDGSPRTAPTWALQSVLVRAPALGLRKVRVTCGDSNLASARVIEKAGGVLEDVRETQLGLTRRYWITL
jgi:hypothetical protein